MNDPIKQAQYWKLGWEPLKLEINIPGNWNNPKWVAAIIKIRMQPFS